MTESRSDLTPHEKVALDAIERMPMFVWGEKPGGVTCGRILAITSATAPWMSHGQLQRALRSLVKKDAIRSPERGRFYPKDVL